MPKAAIKTHPAQMTLNYDASLPERFATFREFLAYRAMVQTKPLKAIASDMELAPSMLSRKLNPGEGDTQRFNVDDLEEYLKSTGDVAAVIEYLAAKYAQSDESRHAAALDRFEQLIADAGAALRTLKGAAR